MSHKLDPLFFQDLALMPPEEVCGRVHCTFDAGRGCYAIEVWGGICEVHPEQRDVRGLGPDAPPVSVELGLTILVYLLHAQDTPVSGEWVSEKDLPGGAMFFRGPHAMPVDLIAERFGHDVPGFRKACEALGGLPLELADAAYQFRILPRVPVAVLLWTGDSEFDAETKILFDRTISAHFPLDMVFGLASEVCNRLGPKSEWSYNDD